VKNKKKQWAQTG